jgi:hypothetical protein
MVTAIDAEDRISRTRPSAKPVGPSRSQRCLFSRLDCILGESFVSEACWECDASRTERATASGPVIAAVASPAV